MRTFHGPVFAAALLSIASIAQTQPDPPEEKETVSLRRVPPMRRGSRTPTARSWHQPCLGWHWDGRKSLWNQGQVI